MAGKNKKIEIIVENGGDSLSARIHLGEDLLTTTGETLEEIQAFFAEQLAAFYDLKEGNYIFEIGYELEGFFETHPYINIAALAERMGVNASLMRQYAKGIKHPSEKRVKEIEEAVHEMGRELLETHLVTA